MKYVLIRAASNLEIIVLDESNRAWNKREMDRFMRKQRMGRNRAKAR